MLLGQFCTIFSFDYHALIAFDKKLDDFDAEVIKHLTLGHHDELHLFMTSKIAFSIWATTMTHSAICYEAKLATMR